MKKRDLLKLIKSLPADADLVFEAGDSEFYYASKVVTTVETYTEQKWDEEKEEAVGPLVVKTDDAVYKIYLE